MHLIMILLFFMPLYGHSFPSPTQVNLHTHTRIHISQGLMYGYATDETPELMPLTIVLAHKLNKQMADYRRDGTLPWIRPDSKSQVKI